MWLQLMCVCVCVCLSVCLYVCVCVKVYNFILYEVKHNCPVKFYFQL